MRHRQLLLAIVLGSLLLGLLPQETAAVDIPVIDELNLYLDGSGTPILVNLTKSFDVISRVIWHLEWSSNDFFWNQFGNAAALINGSNIVYNSTDLLPMNLTENESFAKTAYDTSVLSDTRAPKLWHLFSRLTFWKFMPADSMGLSLLNGETFQIHIQDDITAVCDDFSIVVEGYRQVKRQAINAEEESPDIEIITFLQGRFNDVMTILPFIFVFGGLTAVMLIWRKKFS